MKLIQKGYDKIGVYWSSLSVDRDVIDYFSLNDSIDYVVLASSIINPKTGQIFQKSFATFGARDVENKGTINHLFIFYSLVYLFIFLSNRTNSRFNECNFSSYESI